jgi:hypothetical protein
VKGDPRDDTSQASQAKGYKARRNHGCGLGASWPITASLQPNSTTSRARLASSRLDLPLLLFRAVVRSAVVPNMETVRSAAEAFDGPMDELVPRLLSGAATVLSRPTIIR